MSGKKLLVIAAVLGLMSFGVAFVLTQMFQTSPEVRKTAAEIEQEKADRTAQVGEEMLKLGPSEIELGKLIKELKRRKMELYERTRDLDEREKRIKMAATELKKDSIAMETLRVELAAPLVRLEQRMQALEQMLITIKEVEVANLKTMAKTFAAMSPEVSGPIVTSMCSDTRINRVAKIVFFMSDRDRAKLFGGIVDPTTRVKLIDEITKVTQQASKG